MKLRPYQVEAVEALRNNKTGIISAATGSGKTTMMAASIKEKSKEGKILVLVHLQQLVTQTAERIADETGLNVGQYFEKRKDDYIDYDVLVATWQSLNKLTAFCAISPDAFYSVNVDEAHHVSGKYLETVTYFITEYLHGFTATPYGPGEEVLFDLFGDVIFSIDIFELIDLGFLSRLDMKVFKSEIKNLNPELYVDYHQRKNEHINRVEAQLRAESRKPKIVHFFKNNKHLNEYDKAIDRDSSGSYVSRISNKRREQIIKKFNDETGDINHLYSIRMLNEGIDLPIINGLIFHEHSGNFRTFTQRLGRGLRVYKSTNEITYINQFLDFTSDVSAQVVIEFQREIENAYRSKGSQKKYKDYVRIDLDQETEEFLDDFKKKFYERERSQRMGTTICAECGKSIYLYQRMINRLRSEDKFICEACADENSVLTSCHKCGDEVKVTYDNYLRYINRDTRFFCKNHFHTRKAPVEHICPTCGKRFQIKYGAYNARIKKGQTKFFCSTECRVQSNRVTMHCSTCGKEIIIDKARKADMDRRGQTKIFCNSECQYKNSQVVVKCHHCGKVITIKKSLHNKRKAKGMKFYCDQKCFRTHKKQKTSLATFA